MRKVIINIVKSIIFLLPFIYWGQKRDSLNLREFSNSFYHSRELILSNTSVSQLKPDYYKSELFINNNIVRQKVNTGAFITSRTLYNPYGVNANLGKYIRNVATAQMTEKK
ncbi:hypothetical protein [Elizabethkingia meningoseptica]|uniref:hypothetical protein n=1 Tax=Elizabethkingia meningoseptica TaxID=238 RepID=UPI00389184E4